MRDPVLSFECASVEFLLTQPINSRSAFINNLGTDKSFLVIYEPNNKTYAETMVMNVVVDDLTEVHDSIIDLYGKDSINIIGLSEDAMKEKIKNTIIMVMDELFNTDQLVVTFPVFKRKPYPTSTGSVIYSVLQENFTIIGQSTSIHVGKTIIVIQKRSE